MQTNDYTQVWLRDLIERLGETEVHKPTCGDVQKISAENYQEYSGSRDDVVSQGYEPCGHCKP